MLEKAIELCRHADKGPNGLLTQLGIWRAEHRGSQRTTPIHVAFHSELVRAVQTVAAEIAYCPREWGISLRPAISGLGTQEMVNLMITDKFKELERDGKKHQFQAFYEAHGRRRLHEWMREFGWLALHEMFDQLQWGETALAISHEPIIALILWGLNPEYTTTENRLREVFAPLRPLEGIRIVQRLTRLNRSHTPDVLNVGPAAHDHMSPGNIKVVGRIDVPQLTENRLRRWRQTANNE